MSDRTYWSVGEYWLFDTPDEAVEHWLGYLLPEEIPETVTVEEWMPRRPDWYREARQAIEATLEHLDEEYGDPDVASKPSDIGDYGEAIDALSECLEKHFNVWYCDRTGRTEILQTAEYIKVTTTEPLKESE